MTSESRTRCCLFLLPEIVVTPDSRFGRVRLSPNFAHCIWSVLRNTNFVRHVPYLNRKQEPCCIVLIPSNINHYILPNKHSHPRHFLLSFLLSPRRAVWSYHIHFEVRGPIWGKTGRTAFIDVSLSRLYPWFSPGVSLRYHLIINLITSWQTWLTGHSGQAVLG